MQGHYLVLYFANAFSYSVNHIFITVFLSLNEQKFIFFYHILNVSFKRNLNEILAMRTQDILIYFLLKSLDLSHLYLNLSSSNNLLFMYMAIERKFFKKFSTSFLVLTIFLFYTISSYFQCHPCHIQICIWDYYLLLDIIS